MLDHIINNPELTKYLISFEQGQTIFLEGDDSQDLYALVSGKLDILKGNHKIAEVVEAGSIFGEMSFLLEEARTASVKAASDVQVIRIPREEVPAFLSKFPEVVREFARMLAKRLDETSKLAFGLKEFCNQLPDAVVLTDRDGRILSLNASAERLYGRESNEMHHQLAASMYENPDEYRSFIEKAISQYTVQEKTLKVNHPQKGRRYVSTSTTVLYDAQHHFQGILSLGRDVTEIQAMERRYRRVKRWLVPLICLLALSAAGVFWGYPYFYEGYEATDTNKMRLRDEMAADYRFLSSMLTQPLKENDTQKTHDVLERFLTSRSSSAPYNGLVLLNRDKKVVDAYSKASDAHPGAIIGSSYGGIAFKGNDESPHRVLTVYREDKHQPMGHKGIEVTFALDRKGSRMGWLIFQMDLDRLEDHYRVDAADLQAFEFEDVDETSENTD